MSRSGFRIMYKVLFIATAVLYYLLIPLQPYPFSAFVKIIPSLVIFVACVHLVSGSERLICSFAFFACVLGDLFLGLDRSGFFLYALLSYLLTHSFLSFAFLRKSRLSLTGHLKALPILIYTVVIGWFLVKGAGNMKLPVLVYLGVISLMTISAGFRRGSSKLYVGAVFFMICDSLIAVDKFLFEIPFSYYGIILNYNIALYLLCFGLIDEHVNGNKEVSP